MGRGPGAGAADGRDPGLGGLMDHPADLHPSTEAAGAAVIGTITMFSMFGAIGFLVFLDLPTYYTNIAYAKRNIESWNKHRARHARKKNAKVMPVVMVRDVGCQADLLEHWRTMRYMRAIKKLAKTSEQAEIMNDMFYGKTP